MYTLDDYKNMIGYCYYYNEIPIGIITNISRDYNGKYIIELDIQTTFITQPMDNKFVLDKLFMGLIYEQFLTRVNRYRFLNGRNIHELVHFTKVENVESILENGLLSNNLLENYNMPYKKSDEYRLDKKLDFICNSITFPNYKMFFTKRIEDSSQEWVVISIASSIMIHKLSTEFYKTNRANSIYYNDFMAYNTNEALCSMFEQTNREENLSSNYTTDPQAEVLIRDTIQTPYIKCINTYKNNEKVKKLTMEHNLGYQNNSCLFFPRSDYKRWK